MKYDRPKLRTLINSLTASELDEALDYFPAVRNQFTDGQEKNKRVNIILDYFEKHQEEFDSFLEAIKKCNLTAYNRYVLISNNTDSKLIEELTDILPQQDDLFGRCVKRAYQDFILQLANDDDLNSESLDEILDILKEYDKQLVILQFISRLVACILIRDSIKYKSIIDKIKKVARANFLKYGINQTDFTKKINHFKKKYQESSNISYLMVSIKDNNAYPNTFQISGWLASDEIIKNSESDLIPLNNQHSGVNFEECQVTENLYALEQIQEIVRNYQRQINCIREVDKLIIEFFLPASLLCLDVDKWIADPKHQILWGSLYQVRIRSLDRLSIQYRDRKEIWKRKWIAVQKCKNPSQQFVSSYSNCNADTLVRRLQDEKFVGLKLSSVLKSDYVSIASALYYTGTPIALWLRCDPQDGDCKTQLNKLLEVEHLLQLPNQIFEQRCKSNQHISLIWDDPNRVTPNYQLK
ncbi:hypothetical protein VB620_16360 [Nodularia harveyana UHCC-0300]|uniref:vWA-MoxR associated protein C-terminal domain-containing protein n=1 Tax=Nodularia harveyana UHCC-0300 TaxID=2974287 RepID=A0ABU5UHC9_9CYAN|nr:hypothetical protein [Nodularia harveyana]MEA5582910.1 hypothetical protein [Nodularia harveyana UHCC-0300]